jgi:dolichol-phosphate mannosyltransferase
MKKFVSIVIPVYNEAGNLAPMMERLEKALGDDYLYEIIFVDDGSADDTLEKLKINSKENVFYISFSRNFGHQNALKAGLDYSKGDCVISLDGDLQHPPELIPEMIALWKKGYDIVYTRRREDKRLSIIKRLTSKHFGLFMKRMSGLPVEQGIADFRLLDRKVVDVLSNFRETELFLRGAIYWLGFRKYALDYTPEERFSGKTKYSGLKMIQLALQGITSFSVKPLYASVFVGIVFVFIAMVYFVYVLWCVSVGQAVQGWASIIVTIMFFGGLNLLVLGIIGIYIGKIFMQTKQRPSYIVRETNIIKGRKGKLCEHRDLIENNF